MIRLWQISDDSDIVEFKFQIEQDKRAGIVMYSRSRKATGFADAVIDGYPENYRQHVRRTLFNMAKADKFPEQYTIAWY